MLVTSQQIGEQIIEIAKSYIGLVEIKPNQEWDDPATPGVDPRANALRMMLLDTHWGLGQPYCAAFAEAVVLTAYRKLNAPNSILNELSAKFTPHVMTTCHNLKPEIVDEPCVGAVFFWEKGHSGQGHAGIVEACSLWPNSYNTIEGNTAAGSTGSIEKQRNGDGVYARVRAVKAIPSAVNFHLHGFWRPRPFEI